MPSLSEAKRPALARVLLWNFALLMAAAVALAIITALAAQALEPRFALVGFLLLIAADLAVLFVFGRYLISRFVLRPLDSLREAADAIAAGSLESRAPASETRELNELADRLNQMTEALLDSQHQLVRAEKLAGAGRLASGIAHEVGNPLAALRTYTDLLGRRGGDPEITTALIREIERIDRIVRGLLSYARPDREETGVMDPVLVARNAVDLLTQQGVLRDLPLECRFDANAPRVRGRAHALEQVLVNLMLNAVDAAPAGPLVVGVESWTYDPAHDNRPRKDEPPPVPQRRPSGRRPRRPDLPAGTPGSLIWVADGGPGVPLEQRELVFDPFYTTKDPGRGTGLGLAIVQRTVHELGGIVWMDDAREGGAVFKVFLPAQRQP